MPTVYPFLYFLPRKQQDRGLKTAQTRDETAAREVIEALRKIGFDYGEPILNFPPEQNPNRLVEEEDLYPVDVSFLKPEDILFTMTRPPIHDVAHGDRKMIEPGNTDIERRVFDAWEPYLEVVARSHIKLAPGIQSELRSGYESRRDMTFRQRGGGYYGGLNAGDGRGPRRPPGPGRTAAFFLRTEELPGNSFGLINAFGMDALMTQVWAYRLRRDFAYLLERPGFAMVEMQSAPVPPRPTNLRFAMNWTIETVILIRF